MNKRKYKLLIADDDESILDSLSLMLEMYDYQVSTALDGNEVMGLLADLPDLLILDTWMSGVDGRDVCREIKADPERKNIPVLMVSASREIEESVLDAGADKFMAKPVDMKEFLAVIAEMCGQHLV